MVKLENSEKKNRCFILGTGSSIKSQNLKLLENETVIGVSGLFMNNDINIINPKYYVLPPVFKYHQEYAKEESYVKWLKDMEKILNKDTIYFLSDLDKPYLDKYNIFEDKKIILKKYIPYSESDILKEIKLSEFPNIHSVSESAIQIALYLGFKEIFLIGFDHDWFNGLYVHFNGKDYLKYLSTNKKDFTTAIKKIDSEFQMKRHASIFNKYKKLYNLKENIYNANANASSYVDVFPKVEFEKLFRHDYKDYISNIKKEFIKIKSPQKPIKNLAFDFNKNFSYLQSKILKLEKNKKYIIYGAGSIGNFISMLIPDNIEAFVDKNNDTINNIINTKFKVYHPKSLLNMNYDNIIISVLGREDEIKDYLINSLGINKNKIITLSI